MSTTSQEYADLFGQFQQTLETMVSRRPIMIQFGDDYEFYPSAEMIATGARLREQMLLHMFRVERGIS
jgi:hypothetical protein